MRKYLLLFFFIPLVSFSQKSITGIVKDNKTNTPLPFANIITNTNKGTITDVDGNFEIEGISNISSITISYIGYISKTIILSPTTTFYEIKLDENIEKLNEVVLVGGENPALQIIRNAIKNKNINNPEKVLNSFKFNTYNKLLVTANPDSINNEIDSVFVFKNGKRDFVEVDSSNYNLKKQLDRSHLYISEKVSDYSFTKAKGRRETILATRMAGFQDPIYEILSLQIQSFSFYDSKYTIFGTDYINPIANNALKTYNYKILDTVNKNTRPAYLIYYFPQKKGEVVGLEGVLYIDTKTYALQKAIAQLKAIIDVKATQSFTYYENEKVWFPTEKEIKIERGQTNENISLFGASVNIQGSPESKDSTKTHTNKQDGADYIHLVSREKNFEIQLNQPVKIRGRGLAIDVIEGANKQEESFWNRYRTDSITQRGKETYVVIDSIIEENKVEKRIRFARKLLNGYFPTKYFDFDLRFLLKYNDFEGFKPGIGIITNDEFSTKYRFFTYGIYGFGDEDFKFGVTASARLNRYTNTWAGLSYVDDLGETGSTVFNTDGRAFFLFEPRLFNLTSFYKTKRTSPYIEHDFTAKIQGKLQLDRSEIDPQFEYTFVTDDGAFTDFELATAALTFQWNPNDEYILTPKGKRTSKQGYPKLTFQLTQSFENLIDGDFNFTKFDFRGIHEVSYQNGSATNFFVRAGIGFGDIPLTHLFNFSPNSPNDDTIFGRFSVADSNSFETLFFNEFFADRYATFQIRHRFNRFKIARKFQPELVLASRAAYGSIEDRERHQNIQFGSLEDGFYESGFELNKLFQGFGLSFFYRYGPNGLPRFEDNISLKFTFNFDFGF